VAEGLGVVTGTTAVTAPATHFVAPPTTPEISLGRLALGVLCAEAAAQVLATPDTTWLTQVTADPEPQLGARRALLSAVWVLLVVGDGVVFGFWEVAVWPAMAVAFGLVP
jgi:hypothetical protein